MGFLKKDSMKVGMGNIRIIWSLLSLVNYTIFDIVTCHFGCCLFTFHAKVISTKPAYMLICCHVNCVHTLIYCIDRVGRLYAYIGVVRTHNI